MTNVDKVKNQNLKLLNTNSSELVIVIVLTYLPALFFWRLITPTLPDQMQIKSGDFTEQYFPLRAFVAEEWVQGRVPLWNPYLYGGQPALADIQSGALYPPHVLEALLLGWGGPLLGWEIGFPLWALEAQVMVHFSIAAIGTYLFARHLGRRSGTSLRRARFMGVIASLVFTYGGYLTGFPVQQLTILEASVWLPWVLWGLSVVRVRGQGAGDTGEGASSRLQMPNPMQHALRHTLYALRPAAWVALAFALAILAGHPQTVLYIFYLSLAYALFLSIQGWVQLKNSQVTIFYPLLSWFMFVFLGSLIAAAQILPTIEFIRHSLRSELSYEAVSAGLPLSELITVLYPGFFGGSPEYVGIASLVLTALAVVLGWPRRDKKDGKFLVRQTPEILFWLSAALIGLLLAFGGHTFLYSLFYLLTPGFEAVRQQERAFLVYSFSAAILAGYGALLVSGPLSPPLRRIYRHFNHTARKIGVVAFILTAFFIYGATAATARGEEVNLFFGVLRHHIFGLIIFSGMVLWLALRSYRWVRSGWGLGLVALWIIFNLFTVNWRFNLEKPGGSDVFTPTGLTQFLQTALAPPSALNLTPDRIVSGGLLPGGNNAAAVHNLQDLTGNTPLQIAAVDTFLQRMPAWRLWQLMNVHYIVDTRDISDPGLALRFTEDALMVFEMGDPFSRARFVSQVEVIPDDTLALDRLANDAFDLRQAAISPAPLPVSLGDPQQARVRLTALTPTTLRAEVETPAPALLVLSQIYYPGWQAKVDSVPTDVERVNVIQQGVVIPAGNHHVEVFYAPPSFWWGRLVSISGLIFWGIVFLWTKKACQE